MNFLRLVRLSCLVSLVFAMALPGEGSPTADVDYSPLALPPFTFIGRVDDTHDGGRLVEMRAYTVDGNDVRTLIAKSTSVSQVDSLYLYRFMLDVPVATAAQEGYVLPGTEFVFEFVDDAGNVFPGDLMEGDDIVGNPGDSREVFFGPDPVAVTTNDLEVADTTVSVLYTVRKKTWPLPADSIVPTNATVTVVYTAAPGMRFLDGQKTYTASFTADKPVNVASAIIVKPLSPKPPVIQLGIATLRYPWDGKLDVGYRMTYPPTSMSATLVLAAPDGRTATKDVTLDYGENMLEFDVKEAFGGIQAKNVKVRLTFEP